MGTNLTARLDNGPQTGAPVHTTNNLETEAREVLRCPQCQLTQFRTQNSLCRRCRADLDTVPEVAAVVADLRAGLAKGLASTPEPGIETAEATGIPVPNVARAIRLWRLHRGMSQRQLAERMRVPRTYVSKIENDKATPTIASLHRMATAMDTSIATLLSPEEMEPVQDAFISALMTYLPQLDRRGRGDLLAASRSLGLA